MPHIMPIQIISGCKKALTQIISNSYELKNKENIPIKSDWHKMAYEEKNDTLLKIKNIIKYQSL